MVKIDPRTKAVAPAIKVILKKIDRSRVVNCIFLGLGRIGSAAIPTLTDLVKDPQTRAGAVGTLAEIGPAAIPALKELAGDGDNNVRCAVAHNMGQAGPAAIPVLTELLAGNDADLRFIAIGSLGETGPDAVPLLINYLKDKDGAVRYGAAQASTRVLGRAPRRVFPYSSN